MKKLSLALSIVLSLIILRQVNAQNQPSISLHYHAFNLFHSGLEIGYEGALLKREKTSKKERTRFSQIYCGPSIGIYHFRGNYTGITMGIDIGAKLIIFNSLELEIFGGTHYLRAQNTSKTYKQTNNGGFEKISGAGNNYLQWRAGIRFGKNFLSNGKPISINLKLGASQLPDLPSPTITPNIWIGLNYYFKKDEK
ncbi:MAG: hypothetical protein AB8B74_11545 [Crocinitomicaceae bacterium]